uniref:Uncharacterized protein n=1 Tax=Arundo donax TaxID=35708 RepID=A0A0A8Y831_ARUDO
MEGGNYYFALSHLYMAHHFKDAAAMVPRPPLAEDIAGEFLGCSPRSCVASPPHLDPSEGDGPCELIGKAVRAGSRCPHIGSHRQHAARPAEEMRRPEVISFL